MGIKIDEAVENKIISTEIVKMLPLRCKCGAELEFSDSIRNLRCTNQKCNQPLVSRIRKFSKKLGIRIVDVEIEGLIEGLNLKTPYQLLLLPEAIKKGVQNIKNVSILNKNELIPDIERVLLSEYELYSIVEVCGIDSIEKVAKCIFDGFNEVEEVYDEIDKGQLSFINEKLGIRSQDSSIISLEIYNKLLELREELIFAQTLFKIKKDKRERLKIAFADNLIPYNNMGELLDILNSGNKYKFVHFLNVNDSTDVLIRNGNPSNSKIRAAMKVNDKYVADLMNQGSLTLNQIGLFKDNELKPLGSKIYICRLDELFNRLKIIGEGSGWNG